MAASEPIDAARVYNQTSIDRHKISHGKERNCTIDFAGRKEEMLPVARHTVSHDRFGLRCPTRNRSKAVKLTWNVAARRLATICRYNILK